MAVRSPGVRTLQIFRDRHGTLNLLSLGELFLFHQVPLPELFFFLPFLSSPTEALDVNSEKEISLSTCESHKTKLVGIRFVRVCPEVGSASSQLLASLFRLWSFDLAPGPDNSVLTLTGGDTLSLAQLPEGGLFSTLSVVTRQDSTS